MQYLVCTARNILIGITTDTKDGTLTPEAQIKTNPMIEMILTTYHKQMEFIDNNLINVKKTNSHRIILDINAAQTLATELQNWTTEAQNLQTKLNESELTCES